MTIYVEPPEVVPGQIMSASNWTDWIVEVSRAMWVYTAKGQIAVASASNELRAMSPGTRLNVLQTNFAGDDVEYAGPVYVDVYKTSAQNLTDGTLIKILLDSVLGSDPYGFFVAASNRIVIPTNMGGLYDIYILGYWDAHAVIGSKRQIDIVHNGTTKAADTKSTPGGTVPVWQQAFFSRSLSAGDTLEFHAQQNSGVSLNLNLIRMVLEKRR